MKNLNSFLHPKRRENIKFVLSDAFVDEDGKPLEWEMRELRASETVEIAKKAEGLTGTELMAYHVAEALVTPNLKDAELVKAVAAEKGGKILQPHEILIELVSDYEMGRLMKMYNRQNSVTFDFGELVEEAKN